MMFLHWSIKDKNYNQNYKQQLHQAVMFVTKKDTRLPSPRLARSLFRGISALSKIITSAGT